MPQDIGETRDALVEAAVALAQEGLTVRINPVTVWFQPRGYPAEIQVVVTPWTSGRYTVITKKRTEVNGGHAWHPEVREDMRLPDVLSYIKEVLS